MYDHTLFGACKSAEQTSTYMYYKAGCQLKMVTFSSLGVCVGMYGLTYSHYHLQGTDRPIWDFFFFFFF